MQFHHFGMKLNCEYSAYRQDFSDCYIAVEFQLLKVSIRKQLCESRTRA